MSLNSHVIKYAKLKHTEWHHRKSHKIPNEEQKRNMMTSDSSSWMGRLNER